MVPMSSNMSLGWIKAKQLDLEWDLALTTHWYRHQHRLHQAAAATVVI